MAQCRGRGRAKKDQGVEEEVRLDPAKVFDLLKTLTDEAISAGLPPYDVAYRYTYKWMFLAIKGNFGYLATKAFAKQGETTKPESDMKARLEEFRQLAKQIK